MDIKYIFVPYEGIFETNIFLKGIFDAIIFLKGIFYANILCAEGGKKNVSSARYPFQIYELYFSINIDFVSDVNFEIEGDETKVRK